MIIIENWDWPQYAILALFLIGAIATVKNHGKYKMVKMSFWNELVTTIIIFTILYFGGFFG